MAKKRSEMTPEEFANNLTKKMAEELSDGRGPDEEELDTETLEERSISGE